MDGESERQGPGRSARGREEARAGPKRAGGAPGVQTTSASVAAVVIGGVNGVPPCLRGNSRQGSCAVI